ncbi:immunogenic protein [Oscillibacter sp.]|jgi:hypothetical protein|uniref:immunogenic protein n=1 Tax=Oscillibacter sp. TaxID=1945593 RepID=UPI002171FAA5|nr:immunogenic protein [Oscillibacter sp.]MCI9648433.1 immunogenic protein [Oscillibacter sp.]
MKRRMWIGLLLTLVLCGCSGEAEVVNTFTETPEELITERIEQGEEVTTQTYYELSDGTWKTDDCAYQYRLVVTGRLHNAVKDTTYTILSNIEEITFDQAWKASGLSSSTEDYFAGEDAVFVAIQ